MANAIPISSNFSSKERKGRKNRPPPRENENAIVSSLAHEINNPLEALLNLLYLLETQATLTKKGHDYLALAREEIRRISQILHAAMKFRDTGDPEDTNLAELLRSVLDFYQSRFDSHGIFVNMRFRLAAKLFAYPRQLRLMFVNLLLNSVDAMPQGGTIYARISNAHEWRVNGRRGIRLTFADNGCGIAPKDLARIWDPFFTTKGAAGNGIGLSLVKNTVQKHHGVLRVRSSTKPGQSGTVFTIFLPSV